MSVNLLDMEIDLDEVKCNPLIGVAVEKINDGYYVERELTVDHVSEGFVLPIGEIREIIDGPVESSVLRNEALMLRYPGEYNQAIQRTLMKFAEMGMYFPPEMADLAGQPVFREFVRMYLHEMGIRVNLPITQIRLHGDLNDESVYNVHLADVAGKELYLADIMLCDPRDPQKRVEGGLGHGIFDKILARIESYGKQGGYAQIGLMAAYERQMRTFRSRGFWIEDSPFGDNAQRMGMSYPMFKFLT